jgi:hypothetical protein
MCFLRGMNCIFIYYLEEVWSVIKLGGGQAYDHSSD